MRRRPLLLLILAWITGILLSHSLSPELPLWPAWLLLLCLLVLAAVLHHARHSLWHLTVILLLTLFGALFYMQTRLPVEQLYPLLDRIKTVRGVVVNYPTHRLGQSHFVLQPEGFPGALQIFYNHRQGTYKPIAYGDAVEITAAFEIPWQFEDFDYRAQLLTRNIWGVGTLWSARDIQKLKSHQGHPALEWGYHARLELFQRIDQYVPLSASGLLKGLLFGERAYLSDEVEMGFRDAGVMHVLAVSGMNLGILIGLFWAVFRLFRLSATLLYVALLLVAILYLLLVGFEVSLVRATLMFGFVALGWVIAECGWILKTWIDPLQGLSAAGLVILIWTPQALFDVSFQLSFAATAGIVIAVQYVLPVWQEHCDRLRLQWDVAQSLPKRVFFRMGEMIALFLLISIAAQLAVAPILAYHFHRIYLAALIANLIVVPLATVALWLGVFLLPATFLPWDMLASWTGSLEGWLLEGLIDATQFFAQMPGAYVIIDGGMQLIFLVALPLVLSPEAICWIQWKLSEQLQ